MCIFCKIINNEIPSYKVYEDENFLAILDIAQVTFGHTLVMCKKHYKNIYDVDAKTLQELITLVQTLSIKIKEKINCEGINILQNNEAMADQSIEHLHFHIIPRYTKSDRFDPTFKDGESVDLSTVLKTINS